MAPAINLNPTIPIPFYADSLRGKNAIKKFFAIPCAANYPIYVEAATAAVMRIAWNIISPDPKEVYHQVFGNSFYHDLKAGLTDGKVFKPLDESAVTRTVFNIADVVDVTLWRMFLFGSVVDGLVDFTSQVKTLTNCKHKNNPNFFQGTGYINAIGDDGRYYGDLFHGTTGDGQDRAGPASFITGNGRGGFAAGSCAFSTFFSEEIIPTETAVVPDDGTGANNVGQSNPDIPHGSKMGHTWLSINRTTEAQTVWEVQSAYTGGGSLPLGEAFRAGNNWYGYCQQT